MPTYDEQYEALNPQYQNVTAADPTQVGQPVNANITDASNYNTSATSSWDRLGNMLSQDNPTMQVAKTYGNQSANSRGLMNSSLVV